MSYNCLFRGKLQLQSNTRLRLVAQSAEKTRLLVTVIDWNKQVVILESIDLPAGKTDFNWMPQNTTNGDCIAYVMELGIKSKVVDKSCTLSTIGKNNIIVCTSA